MKCKHDSDPMTCLRCIAVTQGCTTEEEIDDFVQDCEYWEDRAAEEAQESMEADDFDDDGWAEYGDPNGY